MIASCRYVNSRGRRDQLHSLWVVIGEIRGYTYLIRDAPQRMPKRPTPAAFNVM
jgi:hypothetical protein